MNRWAEGVRERERGEKIVICVLGGGSPSGIAYVPAQIISTPVHCRVWARQQLRILCLELVLGCPFDWAWSLGQPIEI